MDVVPALAGPHLAVVSGEPDFELQRIARTIAHSVTVDGPLGLERLLLRLAGEAERAGAPPAPRTLDLIGHTRGRAALMALGDWTIDGACPATLAWFRRLADRAVLPRLGIRAVRLLGCGSAVSAPARATICRLADLLGVEVLGAHQLLHAGHYDAGGFRDCWSFLLVSASELRGRQRARVAARDLRPRVLDLEALPTVALGSLAGPWPRRLADPHAAREILALVRRREGGRMLGPSPAPTCELALPTADPDAFHIAHVLLDGDFLRFYPDGLADDGIAFPVDDARALRRLLATLRC